MKRNNLIEIAIKAAKVAGDVHLRHFRKIKAVERKKGRDIITSADLEAEKQIISVIRRNFPDHNILTEESSVEKTDSDYLWVVDPIDGTINFASGLPLFCVSIGAQRRGITECGVVFVPALERLYHAVRGKGSYLNGEKLRVSKTDNLSDAVISIILTSHFSDKEINKTTKIISELSKQTRGIRIFLSEGVELSFIAQGILDGNLCIKADPYGAVAGKLIIEEAGGMVTDLFCEDFTNSSTTILATNGKIHNTLSTLVSRLFSD